MTELSKPEGWNKPRPTTLPSPSYWPAALALGIVLVLLGIITTILISIAGLALSVFALRGWIGDVRNES